jgi:hypothetical protein
MGDRTRAPVSVYARATYRKGARVCVCVCVCVCVRARACVRACARALVAPNVCSIQMIIFL